MTPMGRTEVEPTKPQSMQEAKLMDQQANLDENGDPIPLNYGSGGAAGP